LGGLLIVRWLWWWLWLTERLVKIVWPDFPQVIHRVSSGYPQVQLFLVGGLLKVSEESVFVP